MEVPKTTLAEASTTPWPTVSTSRPITIATKAFATMKAADTAPATP